jgi:hypothetical protein
LYSKYEKLIEVYQEKPVLGAIIREIEGHITEIRIKQINKVLANYNIN